MGGLIMDMAALSMVMNQSKVQTEASIAVMKMAMDTNKEAGTQVTEMMKDVVADPNLGKYIDVRI
jgi:hypothetical protein